MSAAANAAGYLYAHGLLPESGLDTQADAASPHDKAKSQSSRRMEPENPAYQGQSQPVKTLRRPRIEYRKRRSYLSPSAA
jgi:hypothetical protein